MDYSSVLKSLALETGISVPSNAFAKPRSRSSTAKTSKCSKCGESYSFAGWCKPCETGEMKAQFRNWTSGNEDLDNFIRETQINASAPYDFIRWIPFESFGQLEFIARGGFGSVYSAESKNFGKVALKFLDKSEALAKDFLDELRSHQRCSLGTGIVDCYGVSKDPETNRYVMVMKYAEQGNLRRYLTHCIRDLTWDEKIDLFDNISRGLRGIHDAGLVHRDFHSGNILRHEKTVYVTDFGMCRPANEPGDTKNIYGVLPYVAPEVLRGSPYTQDADIYSLGMIMWELSAEEPPFADRAHDYVLARDICEGLRPPIISGTPKGYVASMLRCLDADPQKRPTISELLSALYKWRYLSDGKAPFQGPKTKKVKTGQIVRPSPSTNTQHPQAFYTSRLLHYPNLPEPKNSDHYTLFDSETGELHTMVRKQSNKREPTRSSTMMPDLPSHQSSVDKSKGKVNDGSSYGHRRDGLSRSMTMGKVDKEMIDRIRAERKKLSMYRWSSVINEVPQQVECSSLSGKIHKD